uniref:Uncharacterized protein n=1 Tax=Anguilla anguilla TaxID=7936 RepID=A0A0E9R818_ANGAN
MQAPMSNDTLNVNKVVPLHYIFFVIIFT